PETQSYTTHNPPSTMFTHISSRLYSSFFLYCYRAHRYLHSFPTRRSSDLFREMASVGSSTPALLQRRITKRLDPGVARGNGTTVVPAGSNSYRAFLLILLASTLPPSGIC